MGDHRLGDYHETKYFGARKRGDYGVWIELATIAVSCADMERNVLLPSEIAKQFAERVLNGGSSESIVFGVDAPWGAGKSSFINFCVNVWQKRQDVIVYRFNPLQYEDRTHLLHKFVDGLVLTIRQTAFIPELRPIITRYSKLISAKQSLKFFGFDVDLVPPSRTVR